MSTIRFTGMASGLDTENMVKELMKARKEPMNRIIRTKQTDEWKRDAYREMNTLLMDLRTSVDSLRFSGNFNKKKASSENDAITSVNAVGTPKLSSYAIEVKQLAKAEMPAAVQLAVDPSITSSKAAIGGTGFTLNVNGKSVSVSATDTIEKVIANIKAANAGVEATFVDGKLLLSSTKGATLTDTGAKTFTVSATGDGSRLGISGAIPSSERVSGQQAKVVINGIEYTSDSNKLTFDGVEFTLKQTNQGSAINVTNATDEDAVFDTIKNFVTKYNDVIAKINAKISEPKYKNYQPLLDEEKEALPDTTVEKMENMAKSGLLLRNSILKSGLDEIRNDINTKLSGTGVNLAFDTLSEIGIGGPPNGKYAYQENGKLYIDETKLRAAIRNNGDDVQKLFTQFSSSSDAATKYKESGLAERLYDSLTATISRVTKEAGSATSTSTYDDSYIGKKIKDEEDQIDVWEDRLKEIEDRYYKQFASMETLMSKAQSQSSWFAQMLGQS
ncbi:flagellar filament capping protein FliD [Brevibacillus centrosporus]|uniref:flagellar filament capping protein FliD n=1 Tax=Brevibacillus centrosporus TaxID=54910 RepID=UPI002E1C0EE9|nr:flagellar filament capping protein FliD [Brevibacillus centrosporus]MED1952369.1 flagellar filament capping protein FliD [Brevibacillus centrosporus]